MTLRSGRWIDYGRFLKDRACANKLQDNIDEVVKSAGKTLTAQNHPAADLRYSVTKNL